MASTFELRLTDGTRSRRLRWQLRLSLLVFAAIATVCLVVLVRFLWHGTLNGGQALTLLFVGGGSVFACAIFYGFERQLDADRIVFALGEGSILVEGHLGRHKKWLDLVEIEDGPALLTFGTGPELEAVLGPLHFQQGSRELVALSTPKRRIVWERRQVRGLETAVAGIERWASSAGQDGTMAPPPPETTT